MSAKNAAESAALREKYNPGITALQDKSLGAVMDNINKGAIPLGERNTAFDQGPAPATGIGPRDTTFNGMAPGPSSTPARDPSFDGGPVVDPNTGQLMQRVVDQAGNPLTNTSFDSPLIRDAVAKAKADLALGGGVPQDVRNLVARKGMARAGQVTGNLGLGRDITARDLGLTSIDLEKMRMAQALQAGGSEANLEQANAAMRLQGEQFGRNNLLQSQEMARAQQQANDARFFQQAGRADQNYATDAQIRAQQDALAAGNFNAAAGRADSRYATDAQIRQAQEQLNSANFNTTAGRYDQNFWNEQNFLQQMNNGDFNRAMSAYNLAQAVPAPATGLDPSAVVNLATANNNAIANKNQQNYAVQTQTANQQATAANQGIGAGVAGAIDLISGLRKPAATTGYAPVSTKPYSNPYTPAPGAVNSYFQNMQQPVYTPAPSAVLPKFTLPTAGKYTYGP